VNFDEYWKINICHTIKIASEFKNVSVTMGVVDGLALHGKLLRPRLPGFDWGGVPVYTKNYTVSPKRH